MQLQLSDGLPDSAGFLASHGSTVEGDVGERDGGSAPRGSQPTRHQAVCAAALVCPLAAGTMNYVPSPRVSSPATTGRGEGMKQG